MPLRPHAAPTPPLPRASAATTSSGPQHQPHHQHHPQHQQRDDPPWRRRDDGRADDDVEVRDGWQVHGGTRAQRRRRRKQWLQEQGQRQQRQDPRRGGDDALDVEDDDEGDASAFEAGGERREQPARGVARPSVRPTEQPAAPPPFTAPPHSRRAVAARSELLRARLDECRVQGDDEAALRQLESEVVQADMATKQAGGSSENKLRLETMGQARKNERKKAAIGRAEKAFDEACKRRDEAVLEVESARSKLEFLRDELEQGLARHAYLAAQQAAEARPTDEVRTVHSALAALRSAAGVLPPELQAQLGVVDQAVSRFYPDGGEAKEALFQAGLAGISDTEISGQSSDSDTDDEPEVTGELLHEHKEARREQKAVRAERQAELLSSIDGGGGSVRDIAAKYKQRAEKAAARLRVATEKLEEGRSAARTRRHAERSAREVQAREAARGADASRPGHRGDDDEVIPCPPPCKWRRAGVACGEDSDATIDETPVLGQPLATPSAATTSTSATAAAAQTCGSAGQASDDGLRHRTHHAQRCGRQEGDGDAGGASSSLHALVADCATMAVQAVSRARVASAERSRRKDPSAQASLVGLMATRWGRSRAASHDGRAADDRGTRRGVSPSEARSKSPRGMPRTTTAMEQG